MKDGHLVRRGLYQRFLGLPAGPFTTLKCCWRSRQRSLIFIIYTSVYEHLKHGARRGVDKPLGYRVRAFQDDLPRVPSDRVGPLTWAATAFYLYLVVDAFTVAPVVVLMD